MKVEKKPVTALQPVPVVLITSADGQGNPNIITVAWAGTLCSEPPMVGIGIRPSRYSHGLIKQSGEFVINIPQEDQLKLTDYCGMVSGRDVDKFAATGFTAHPASRVKAPLIKECPVNLECVVRQVIGLGSHDLFLAEIVAYHVDREVMNEKGRIDPSRFKPFAYNGQLSYMSLGAEIGTYGFSQKSQT